MTTTTPKVHRPLAALNLPRSNSALVTYAQNIVTGMSGNAYFTTPNPPLPTITVAIGDLHSAEAAALTRAKGAATLRNAKRATLVSLLQEERAYIQGVADRDPENAASIIESARLSVKKVPTHTPRVFAAKPGANSGTVMLVAPSAAHRSAYDWEYSIDGAKTWLALPSTLQARTSVTGLTPGSSVQFRYRALTKTGEADWSQPITMPLVK